MGVCLETVMGFLNLFAGVKVSGWEVTQQAKKGETKRN